MKVELQDQTVFVRLTNDGVGTLHGLVPSGTGFRALVVDEKPYGLWLVPEGSEKVADDTLTLVRWNYLQAVTLMPKKPGAGRGN
jgi:hypothetical protein